MNCPKCGEEFPMKTLIGEPTRKQGKRYLYCQKCGAVTPEEVVWKQIKRSKANELQCLF